jgi:hypothetical protein
MASADEYASWIVKNQSLKGTPQFDTVTKAYEEAKAEESLTAGQQEVGTSVLTGEPLREEASTGRKLAQSLGKGVVGVFDLVAGAPEDYRRMAEYFTTENMPAPRASAPIRTALTKAGVFTPEAEFNTPIGRVAGFTTELAGSGGINPRNVVRAGQSMIGSGSLKPIESFSRLGRDVSMTGVTGLAGGTTSETLNSIGVDSPVAQFLATGGTMAVAGTPLALRSTAGEIAKKGFENVTPQQIKQADDLLKFSNQQGNRLTAAEALAQVTGTNPLIATQRVVENMPKSAPTMSNFMNVRPQSNVEFMERTLAQVSPRVEGAERGLQRTAEQSIDTAKKMRTQAVDPFYKEAGKMAIPKDELTGYLTDPRIKDAVDYVRKTGEYGVKNMPENDMRVLIAAKQFLDDDYKTQTAGATGIKGNAGGVTWAAREKLDNFLASKSPIYAQGRDIYNQVSTDVVDPLKSGRVGQISDGGVGEAGMRTQQSVLMPTNPQVTTPKDIKATVQALRRQDPNAVPAWTRQSLEGIFNETAQKLQGGENQFGGAKFAQTIAGNKQQRENLKALVMESSGMQAWNGFEKMLDVMEAQGKRQPMNSATAFNQMIAEEFKQGGVGKLATTAAKPSQLANAYDEFRMGKNAQLLAKLLTDPDGINKLKEISNNAPNSAKTRLLVNSLLGGYIAQKPEITEESK